MDLRSTVDGWNCNNAVGAKVEYRKEDGSIVSTTTRTQASVLSEHTPVIWLDGVSGCVALDRVTPATAMQCFGDGNCDLVPDYFLLADDWRFVCRKCQTGQARMSDGTWYSFDWNGPFPWERPSFVEGYKGFPNGPNGFPKQKQTL